MLSSAGKFWCLYISSCKDMGDAITVILYAWYIPVKEEILINSIS